MPAARSVTSLELHGRGQLGIALELHPADIAAARARIEALVRDLAEAKTPAGEVERARLAVMIAHTSEESSNDWWASRLALVLRDGRIEKAMLGTADAATILRDDVVAFLNRFVAGHDRIIVIAHAAKYAATARVMFRNLDVED
jgi:hypothetical protein